MKSLQKYRLITLAALLILPLLGGCSFGGLLEMHPKGPIAQGEWDLMLSAFGLMLIVLIPVFVMTFWFTWHYRASNLKARYMPDWSQSLKLEAIVWLVPALIVLALASLTWIYTHRLHPSAPLQSEEKPLEVQVIALDWKWLFIYPQQQIASVNRLVFPADRPVHFDIVQQVRFSLPAFCGRRHLDAGLQELGAEGQRLARASCRG